MAYRKNDDPIRTEPEYPAFMRIDIRYQRNDKPDFDRKYEPPAPEKRGIG